MPLTGVAQQAAELRKREAFLKRQINAMKDELDFRKKLDADGNVLPKGVLEIFTGADDTAVDSDSSEDFEGYDDDDDDGGGDGDGDGDGDDDGVVGGEDSEDEDATKQRVAPSLLRKELLDSGVPATVLSLDLGALPKSLSVARLVNEIVCVPYHGQPCFLFAVRPAKDGDVSDVVRVLMRLSKHCSSDDANICRFLGAADYHDHVLVALQHSGGPTLARVARAASDGDLAVSSALQVALALDLARGLSRLHRSGVAHGAVRPQAVTVTLHQPVTAALVYTGTFSQAPKPKDIRDLGLVFATLALGRMVTLDTLPTAAELRTAPAGKEDPPWEAFCELAVQMTQGADEALRPTAANFFVYRLAWVSGGCARRSLPAMLLVLCLSSPYFGSRKRRD
jgi:hypothetical protein